MRRLAADGRPRRSRAVTLGAFRLALWLGMAICCARLEAQEVTTPVASPDPLMTLMLAQPHIDVESPVVPTALFEPSVVKPGESVVYRLNFNALEASIEMPREIPGTEKLPLRAGGHGQLLLMVNTNYQPNTAFNFHARPTAAGQYTIPSFTLRVYGKTVTVPAATLQVIPNAPPPARPFPQLGLEVLETNIYVGQAVRVLLHLPPAATLVPQTMSPLQIHGQGFIVDQALFRARVEPRQFAPGAVIGIPSTYEGVLTPLAAGRLTAFAQAFVAGRFGAPLAINAAPGSPVNLVAQLYTLLDSPLVTFNVRPLPKEGELPGFTGAVGNFFVDEPQLSSSPLRAGDPVRLTVRVRGEGNLVRLVPPPPPKHSGWQVFSGTAESPHPQIVQAQGFRVFSFTLIPVSASVKRTPEIPFSCFDPVEGKYTDITIPGIPVAVEPSTTPIDAKAIARAESLVPEPQKEPALAGLSATPGLAASSMVPFQRQAWFRVVQIAPAAGFFALWRWDRRRRFLEAHPDVVLRRRARRALRRLRRTLNRVAQAGRSTAFVSSAVDALRVAVSPHYPAEPRALVCSDVLAILPEPERTGRAGEVVREFFANADSLAFATQPTESRRLVALKPELDTILEALEERLYA